MLERERREERLPVSTRQHETDINDSWFIIVLGGVVVFCSSGIPQIRRIVSGRMSMLIFLVLKKETEEAQGVLLVMYHR